MSQNIDSGWNSGISEKSTAWFMILKCAICIILLSCLGLETTKMSVVN